MSTVTLAPEATRPDRVSRRARKFFPARRLHLIDIENLCAGHVVPTACAEFLTAYARLGITGDHDHHVVGVSPYSLAGTGSLPSGWRRVMGPAGPQSADLALLAAEPAPTILTTYVELVIASADHAFAGLAVRAVKAGIRVTLVTAFDRPPHWRLYQVADAHLTLPHTRTSITGQEAATDPSASSTEDDHVPAPAPLPDARKSHPARKSGLRTAVCR